MLPDKIEVCPIIDTVVEIRFSTEVNPIAVFGIIFNEFKKEYPHVEKLPILQIPDQLRDSDPNFRFKPHYKIHDGKFVVQIGPDVLTISSPMPYIGWDSYSQHIIKFYKRLFGLRIIKSVSRLGVRYINFFEQDIFEKVNVELKFGSSTHSCTNTLIRTEIADRERGFKDILQIANNITHIVGTKVLQGSIIDIDTYKDYTDNSFLFIFEEEINQAHGSEKDLFFRLLKEEFLVTLRPIYNDHK